jgi:hypothetical protein
MQKRWILVFVLGLALSACGMIEVQGQIIDPTESVGTQITTRQEPTEEPTEVPTEALTKTPEVPAPSFDAVTYRDAEAGFEFDYPSDWGIGFQERHSRGYFVQLEDIEGMRLEATVYLWDPKGDLPAYLEVRRRAFESSGNIVEENSMTLTNGQEAVTFLVESLDGNQSFIFITTLHDRYLQLSGGGDLELLREIAGTVRLFDPVKEVIQGEPIECFTVMQEDDLWVPCNVIDALRSRNLAAGPGWMANPFTIGYWGSEGRTDTPDNIMLELQTSRLPQDPAMPMTFTADREAFPPLSGMPPEVMFGPDLNVTFIVYSEGWGLDGKGAALLYFVENEVGDIQWYAIAYSNTHFDK